VSTGPARLALTAAGADRACLSIGAADTVERIAALAAATGVAATP
jgi:hypothetical protein